MIPFELAAIFSRLQAPATRADGAAALARLCHASAALVFGHDDEVGLFLPAPGLPQTLRDGSRWQQFLRACGHAGSASAVVADPRDGQDCQAYGICDAAHLACIVFLGGAPAAPQEQRRRAPGLHRLPRRRARRAAGAGHQGAAAAAGRQAGGGTPCAGRRRPRRRRARKQPPRRRAQRRA
jgi:hypothetical protein